MSGRKHLTRVLEGLKQHQEHTDEIDQIIRILTITPSWKRISTRIPAKDGEYLVTYYGGRIVARFCRDTMQWYATGIGHVEPTYWCPLPDAPKS